MICFVAFIISTRNESLFISDSNKFIPAAHIRTSRAVGNVAVATPANDNDVELIISFSVFVLCSHYLFAFNVDRKTFPRAER